MVSAALISKDQDGFPHPFGQYILLQNFARGGMGEVYLAKAGGLEGLEKYCVLKKLRSELTLDREYVTRFIDEARVVVTLNHKNICHVFDVGRVIDEYYLAMEYVSGRDVRTIIDRATKKQKAIPQECALNLVCETLEALDYAHRRLHPMSGEALNLVHRDVSPQNVLVAFEGEVKLIDFGLAASKLKVERTQPNVVMGKMAYMAPEQARGDPIDLRADMFACGVLCYELLVGERFYEGMSANDIWNVAGKGGFVPPKWHTLDRKVAEVLAQALHPEAKKRFATCGEMRSKLAGVLHASFPGSGAEALRGLMAELFAEEVQRERDMFARFGAVHVSSFRDEMESTKSHSITIVQSTSGVRPEDKATQLVRNEFAGRELSNRRTELADSAPHGGMPPPTDLEANTVLSSSSSGPHTDVHVEATRVVSAERIERKGVAVQNEITLTRPADRRSSSTSERTPQAYSPSQESTGRMPRVKQTEATQMVRDRGVARDPSHERPKTRDTVDMGPGHDEITHLGHGKRNLVIAASLLALGSLLVVGALVIAGQRDAERNAAARPVVTASPSDVPAPTLPVPAKRAAVAPAPDGRAQAADAAASETASAAASAVAPAPADDAAAPTAPIAETSAQAARATTDTAADRRAAAERRKREAREAAARAAEKEKEREKERIAAAALVEVEKPNPGMNDSQLIKALGKKSDCACYEQVLQDYLAANWEPSLKPQARLKARQCAKSCGIE